MKRLTRRLFALLAALALLPVPYARAADEPLFPRARSYDGQFVDVAEIDWFRPYVAACYECALMNGRDTGFAPYSDVTTAELVTLAARLRAMYLGDTITDTVPWSVEPYAAYLREQGVYDDALTPRLAEKATRAQLAGIFAVALPESCFDGRNDALVTGAYASGRFIPDVYETTPYREQILWLYRNGLLTGVDARGRYLPHQHTTRAEVAAIVARIADPALRLTPAWKIVPSWSAFGETFSSLVVAPLPPVSAAPAADDTSAVDALVRQMLAADKRTIFLSYPSPEAMPPSDALMDSFLWCIKTYCEQMYNSVIYHSAAGSPESWIEFSAVDVSGEELTRRREATMARAIEIHDSLWESGKVNEKMSKYEIAKTYFLWLCDHCVYDWDAVNNHSSDGHLAYNALIEGKAVCDGYTGAYNLLLKLEGIDCYGLCNDNHIWTVALLDDGLYHIDVTWGDQSGYADMRYFAMTREQSYRFHAW